jgi:hypothetical protein
VRAGAEDIAKFLLRGGAFPPSESARALHLLERNRVGFSIVGINAIVVANGESRDSDEPCGHKIIDFGRSDASRHSMKLEIGKFPRDDCKQSEQHAVAYLLLLSEGLRSPWRHRYGAATRAE